MRPCSNDCSTAYRTGLDKVGEVKHKNCGAFVVNIG